MKRIFKKILSLIYWYHPALRFSLKYSIDSFRNISIGKNSRVKCNLELHREGTLRIGGNVQLAKTCSLSVGGGKSNLVIEDGVAFGDFCKVSAADGSSLKIKEKTSFYSHATLSGDIEIGTNCLFGPNVTVLSGTHNINGRKLIRDLDREYIEKNGNVYSEKIQIGDDCWLGVNSVILPGVTLGKGCVVGANSVVTKSFEDYAVIGGIPAKLLKYRPE